MSRLIAPLALVVALLSLALNVYLIVRLDRGRTVGLEILDHTSQQLSTLSGTSVSDTVHIKQAFSVSGEMPFNQTFTVPISMTVPFSRTMSVNVNTPIGPMDIPFSINTSVPVNMVVPVTINQTVPYSLTVPLDLQVPFEINLRQLGIESSLNLVQTDIQRLRDVMQ